MRGRDERLGKRIAAAFTTVAVWTCAASAGQCFLLGMRHMAGSTRERQLGASVLLAKQIVQTVKCFAWAFPVGEDVEQHQCHGELFVNNRPVRNPSGTY